MAGSGDRYAGFFTQRFAQRKEGSIPFSMCQDPSRPVSPNLFTLLPQAKFMKHAAWIIIALLGMVSFGCRDASREKTGSQKSQPGDTAVSVKTYIQLGGEPQYVEMTGSSSKLPILLFLHGGPGWPQTPQLRYFNAELCKHMILVSWDQRGCGLSLQKYPKADSLSLAQMVSDAHELTGILQKKFGQQKIYLAGFSWGSILGLKLAEEYPQDYAGYFAVSQVLNLNKNIEISRAWIRKQALLQRDQGTLRQLEKIERKDTSVCKRPIDCFLAQFQLLNKYHGAIYRSESDSAIEKSMAAYPDYKNYDWMGGFLYSAYRLEKELFQIDLRGPTELKVPVYFLMGRHDWNVPPEITLPFIDSLKAPLKEIIWFENSGHEPLEEEAAKFNATLISRIK